MPLAVVAALLDLHVEIGDVEELRHGAEHAPRQQLERRIRGLVGVADRLALFDFVEQAGHARIVLVHLQADAVEFGQHVGAAGLVRHQELAAIADRLGRDVLVGRRVLHDRRCMDAGLGCECAFADIGSMPVRGAVQPLVQLARHLREPLQLLVRHIDLEAIGEFLLQLQCRDDRDEVGIAATLAQSVQRALDLAGAGAHGGERIGDRLFGVVVGVDADMIAGDDLDHFGNDRFNLVRQRAAIRIAQHHPAGAFVVSGARAGQRIGRIGLVAVEEMLAVEQHFAVARPRRANAVADRGEVFFERGLERDADVVVPGLRHEADRLRVGLQQRGKARIVRRRAAGPARHAERGEDRAHRVRLGEQLRVGRVRAGVAALDVVNAEVVQHACYRKLVGQREVDAVGLRAVAQRGVEKVEPLMGHRAHQM